MKTTSQCTGPVTQNELDGRIYFFRDVYGRDKKLLNELKKSM